MTESNVRKFLAERGVADSEIDAAIEAGSLPLLIADQLLLPGHPRYTREDISRLSGVDPEVMTRLWRAMGFPDPPEGERDFYDADLEALCTVVEQSGGVVRDEDIHQARVVSSAMSRIAEVGTDGLATSVRALREAGATEEEIGQLILDTFSVDAFERLLAYLLRRQLRAAVWRRLGIPTDQLDQTRRTVGFVDLVRFTAITEQVPEDELERLVTRFEEVSHDVVTAGGGRVVKMIGDAVMYVVDDDPSRAVEVAVELVEAHAADDLLPPARAGLALGPMLFRDGDYFGPVVNLASRIVDVARPNTIVASDELHSALEGSDRFVWRRLPPKRLKGIGYPPLWALRRLT
jgi:adenylate cyclase